MTQLKGILNVKIADGVDYTTAIRFFHLSMYDATR